MFIFACFVDSASLPFKFLTRLPGVCSGGEGTPPETLKCLTPNPYNQNSSRSTTTTTIIITTTNNIDNHSRSSSSSSTTTTTTTAIADNGWN